MLVLLLVTSWIVILLYWVWFSISFRKQIDWTNSEKNTNEEVSVVVCYKNEVEHIVQTIRSILKQKYPLFEVIAMNDFSTDGSREMVAKITDKRLKCYDVKEDRPGKKQAIEEAVSKAKYEKILFTDADCVPSSDYWIALMASKIDSKRKTEIVLGFAPLNAHKGLLSYFQRYETVLTAMQYISYAMSGIPYMGVGRNLLYTKHLFTSSGGMQDLMHVASGDDDLMVSKISRQNNVGIVLHPGSFVYSEGQKSLKGYLQQKSRHISTSVHYKLHHKLLLTVFAVSQIAFYLLLIMVIVTGTLSALTATIVLLTKWCAQHMLHREIIRKLHHKELLLYFPVLDFGMALYYMIMPFVSLFLDKKWR